MLALIIEDLKDVISYRTEDLDNLKKIAKIRNVSLSTITREIIQDYFAKHEILDKYYMISDGRSFIASAFENLEPKVFDKIATIDANEFVRGAKMSMNDFSLQNLLSSFTGWVKINNLKLSEFDEEDRIRWICETKMGKNYNEITANSFKKALEIFGFVSNVESFSKDDFELVFLKKKK